MKIAVVGAGHVGLANAAVLAQQHEVVALDIDARTVALITQRRSPLRDEALAGWLATRPLNLRATLEPSQALGGAQLVMVATPTSFDPLTHRFDTQSVEAALHAARLHAPQALLVVRSTVPVGFTRQMRARHAPARIVFCPEFLREGLALHDTLYPSRIVVGDAGADGQEVASLLRSAALDPQVAVRLTGSDEAEAIKLFANTYLAMRVAFFNELDTYAALQGLDTRQIIEGVGLDPRIGTHYNNPSFGYGGYCLPKDTQQLLANYEGVPQSLIRATVAANATRQDFIAEQVLARRPSVVGIYRLVMKAQADNFRSSSVLGVMQRLAARGVELIVYEPLLADEPGCAAGDRHPELCGARIVADLPAFKREAQLILANRLSPQLDDVREKVYSRDVFGGDG